MFLGRVSSLAPWAVLCVHVLSLRGRAVRQRLRWEDGSGDGGARGRLGGLYGGW